MQPDANAKTNAATALAAFLFLAALAWLSVALVEPPRAVPEGAPASEFSSARALRHVRAVAQRPHPTGSEEIERGDVIEHEEVKRRLAKWLDE